MIMIDDQWYDLKTIDDYLAVIHEKLGHEFTQELKNHVATTEYMMQETEEISKQNAERIERLISAENLWVIPVGKEGDIEAFAINVSAKRNGIRCVLPPIQELYEKAYQETGLCFHRTIDKKLKPLLLHSFMLDGKSHNALCHMGVFDRYEPANMNYSKDYSKYPKEPIKIETRLDAALMVVWFCISAAPRPYEMDFAMDILHNPPETLFGKLQPLAEGMSYKFPEPENAK